MSHKINGSMVVTSEDGKVTWEFPSVEADLDVSYFPSPVDDYGWARVTTWDKPRVTLNTRINQDKETGKWGIVREKREPEKKSAPVLTKYEATIYIPEMTSTWVTWARKEVGCEKETLFTPTYHEELDSWKLVFSWED